MLEDFQFIDGAKHLLLNVETEPIVVLKDLG
jgi:hypothetical protein